MTQSLISVIVFVLVLICIPFLVRWAKNQKSMGGNVSGISSRVISATAVGPHQRVVTVEVGTEGDRTRLILGVTPQSISCLHVAQVTSPMESGANLSASPVERL
jgi:flagellar protein FliO/FliZ